MATSQKRIHLVWCHPRTTSLTSTIVQTITAELEEHGVAVDELDLYRSSFSGNLFPPDEPDWDNPEKLYTPEVHEYSARALNTDAIIFVFPVWWYSLPALLKGYIDRVWNFGLLYGNDAPHGIQAVRWIGLAGHSLTKLQKRQYDTMLEHHLNTGIAGYCGIPDSQVTLLCDTLGEEAADLTALIEQFKLTVRSLVQKTASELSLSS